MDSLAQLLIPFYFLFDGSALWKIYAAVQPINMMFGLLMIEKWIIYDDLKMEKGGLSKEDFPRRTFNGAFFHRL